MSERWLPVVGFEGYEVSDQGRVRSWRHKSGRRARPVLIKGLTERGYRRVGLRREGEARKIMRPVHQLVLEAFVGPCPPGQEVAHGNGVRGDNTLGNLRWDTKSGNAKDRAKHGTQQYGSAVHTSKLTAEQVAEIRRRYAAGGIYQYQLAAEFGVVQNAIHSIVSGKSWRIREEDAA